MYGFNVLGCVRLQLCDFALYCIIQSVKDASRLMCIPELAGFIQFYWRIFYHQFHRFSNEHIHGLNIITM